MSKRGCTCIIMHAAGDAPPVVIMDPDCPTPKHRKDAVHPEGFDRG